MIKEVIDNNSGAILYKKDEDTLRYEEIIEKLGFLEERISNLEKLLEGSK